MRKEYHVRAIDDCGYETALESFDNLRHARNAFSAEVKKARKQKSDVDIYVTLIEVLAWQCVETLND